MKINIELSGGLELLFDKVTSFYVDVDEKTTLKDLIKFLRENKLKERPELFVQGATVYVPPPTPPCGALIAICSCSHITPPTESNHKLTDQKLRSCLDSNRSHSFITNEDLSSLFATCTYTYSRPGILVLVNDTDWELLGGIEYELQPNDNVVFISTLHGG
eukprot:GEZU01004000.1.p1 GENE.GEZU01004000.1~~GEZU01004000.1.p1  ORF type:complete len:185 (+),score=24.37 GEZU01004000.1:74-556(+)